MTKKTFALTTPTKLGKEITNFAKVQQSIQKTPSDAWKNGFPKFQPKTLAKPPVKPNVSDRKEYQKRLTNELLLKYLEKQAQDEALKVQQSLAETLEEIKSIQTEDKEILGEGDLHCSESLGDLF